LPHPSRVKFKYFGMQNFCGENMPVSLLSFIVLLGVYAVAIIIGIWYFLYGKKGESETSE
jgi:hypothetical protein